MSFASSTVESNGVAAATPSKEDTSPGVAFGLTDYRTCAIAVPLSGQNSLATILTNGKALKAVVAKSNQLWESGATVTYSYVGGTPNQQFKVDTVVKEWFPYANVSFELADVGQGTLRISFDPTLGSWSYVGTVNTQVARANVTMNLGWIGDNATISADDRSVILHEFGHVLGLLHEHQSPARGGKIHLDEDKVYAYYGATQAWNKATIKAQIIDVYNSADVSNYSALDLTSIMMYFMPPEMNLERINVPPNYVLSDMDKAFMAINYPRPTPHADAPMWTLDYALKVAGVDVPVSQKIKTAKGDVAEIRRLFTAFSVARHALASPASGVNPSGTASTMGPVSSLSLANDTLFPADTWCGCVDPFVDAVSAPEGVLHGFVNQNTFWAHNSVVTYGFLDPPVDPDAKRGVKPKGVVTKYRMERVAEALERYEAHVSIKFKYVDIAALKLNLEEADDRLKCQVRISFGDVVRYYDAKGQLAGTLYGWSDFGTTALVTAFDPAKQKKGGEKWATIFLGGQPRDGPSEITRSQMDQADATLYHELGHMLGLWHEHDSPNSEVYGKALADPAVATMFDPDSVMLYSNIQYLGSLRRSTLNSKPSQTDLDLLQLLYPDSGDPTSKFAKALDAFRFSDEDKKEILDKAARAVAMGGPYLGDLLSAISQNFKANPRLSLGPLSSVAPPAGPQHALGAEGGTVAEAQNSDVTGFLSELVNSLKQFFNPGGNQIFTLQFPGRFLDQGSYAWDTGLAGVYGQFIKPTAVNEAEFRLVDQLYDLTDRVAGPNGTNLSIVYEQLLNNLLPKYVENGLAKQQDQIRGWLMKEVDMSKWIRDIMGRQQDREKALASELTVGMSTAPASSSTTVSTTPAPGHAVAPMFDVSSKSTKIGGESLNRIELSELLMNEYLYAKQDWEMARDKLIIQASQADIGTPESQKALNELTRKLAHITATRQAQLASKYSDAVVRGYSHTVREYMGYLDIASPAEALQNAKDSLRESAMSSLDGSMKVYPVQLSPLDWFGGLSTSFTMEDLTQDPEIIRSQINAKSQQLDTLNAQLVALRMGAKGDPKDLQNKVLAAQKDLDNAQSTLAQTYSNNIISMASTCLDAFGKVDIKTLAGKLGMAESVLDKLDAQTTAVKKAQDSLTASSRALSQMMAAQALAEATDTRQEQQQLTLRIQSLTSDLRELKTRWQAITVSTSGRWQSITFTSSKASRGSAAKQNANASSEQLACNLWIASGSGNSTSSGGSIQVTSSASDDTIDLAFRATLVTVDRGGWFQPQFFKESKAFYKVNEDISWVDNKTRNVKGLMPGFPVAFLIAKDIVVRVVHSANSSTDNKSNDQTNSASSGGFLCFSYSHSDSSNSSSDSSSFQAFNNGFVVKIPGPQVLGYMIQKTDPDDARMMPNKLPDSFFIPDDAYNKTVNGAPAHGANPASGVNTGKAPAAGGSTTAGLAITQDGLRDVLSKMLAEKVDELFEKVKVDGTTSS
ncbi:hypothetical protein B0H10DRAFT_1993760 [Mycena sp. CBHHK59/15]|nr:hypothetical protein B0H10DRAFT_1993760 [Mycena sp. CBHHK59/15]